MRGQVQPNTLRFQEVSVRFYSIGSLSINICLASALTTFGTGLLQYTGVVDL